MQHQSSMKLHTQICTSYSQDHSTPPSQVTSWDPNTPGTLSHQPSLGRFLFDVLPVTLTLESSSCPLRIVNWPDLIEQNEQKIQTSQKQLKKSPSIIRNLVGAHMFPGNLTSDFLSNYRQCILSHRIQIILAFTLPTADQQL